MSNELTAHHSDGSQSLLSEIATLSRREVELGRRLAEARARARRAEEECAALTAEREDLTERRLSLIGGWLCELSRQAAEGEEAQRSLERRAHTQEAMLRDACELLRQLDDPYGYGSSIDDRIAGETQDRQSDEAEG